MNDNINTTTKLFSLLGFLCLLMISTVSTASTLTSTDGLTVDGFSLPGITLPGWPNFENDVKVHWQKMGKKGYRLRAHYSGGDFLFNRLIDESHVVEEGSYQLKAWFDVNGIFLHGGLKITGNLSGFNNIDGTPVNASGELMTADLDGFAWTDDMIGFNTTDIFCRFFDFCTENESVYLSLDEGGFNPGMKKYKSSGLAVTTVPLPAGIWLFGSGLIGMIVMARCKKKSAGL